MSDPAQPSKRSVRKVLRGIIRGREIETADPELPEGAEVLITISEVDEEPLTFEERRELLRKCAGSITEEEADGLNAFVRGSRGHAAEYPPKSKPS